MSLQENFINTIAPICIKYAKKYGYKCVSAAVAQAILESAYGTSNKAKQHNYFGLKFRENRLNCNDGYFIDGGSEQNKDGSYTNISTKWFKFSNMDRGVEGYYQFININNYKEVKKQEDPKRYLEELKKAGYASSLDYVDKVYKVVEKNNLRRFDIMLKDNEDIEITDVDFYGKKQNDRTKPISKITIHHMAGVMTGKRCAEYHRDSNREASSNFYIGNEGDIVRGIPEDKRAWTSSNRENDNISLTIEVSNCSGAPDWKISDKAFNSLIKLCKYLCNKYNINLIWTGDKTGTLTTHNMFSKTACPGPYLYSKMKEITELVNSNQKNVVEQNIENNITKENNNNYLVRVKITDLNIRESHTTNSRSKGFIKPGIYTIVEEVNGWGKLKSGAGWIYLKYADKI